MNRKLTLKLEGEIIEKAKVFAKLQHKSLSKIVGDYFNSLTLKNTGKKIVISPLVKELSGIVDIKNAKKLEDNYTNYLIEKYK